MLGPSAKEFTDLDRAGGQEDRVPNGASGGPTSQNIDLSNLNFDPTSPVAAASPNRDSNGEGFHEDDAGGPSGDDSNMNGFAYTPTPFNPAKTDRCLLENVVIMAVLFISMVLGIASLATEQLHYQEDNLKVKVFAGTVRGCLRDECSSYIVPHVFCKRYMDNSAGYLACMVLGVLISLAAFVFSICSACGRACISKYLVIALSLVAWLFFLVSVICLSTLRTSKLCKGVSLGELGFQYGPAFPLVLTLFLLLSLSIVFYFVMRRMRPVRYYYN